MTNLERIKGMSADELAELLTSFDYGEICDRCCPRFNEYGDDSCTNFCTDFVEVVKDWLEQEVDEC